MKKIDFIATGRASTDGNSGYFTGTKREITVKLLPTSVYFEEYEGSVLVSAHLEAYFDPNEWDYKKEGLIYTDQLFWEGVRDLLKSIGIEHHEDFFYSEQGMQGDDYVDFDMGEDLARELLAKGLTYEDEDG